jgi:hypothetical protein
VSDKNLWLQAKDVAGVFFGLKPKNLIDTGGIAGQSNLPFFDTGYQKIDSNHYIGQYRIGLDWFHHCVNPL